MVTNPLCVLIAIIQYSTFCYLILSVLLQMHHTNHMTICSNYLSPFSLLFANGSQLLTLQHDLRRGAGEQDGAGLWSGENCLDVEPLACQSCIAAACTWRFLHWCRDALMPLCCQGAVDSYCYYTKQHPEMRPFSGQSWYLHSYTQYLP